MKFIEFDVDYEACGNVEEVILHDEYGRHESVVFRRVEHCEMEYISDFMGWHCKSCDLIKMGLKDQRPRFCPNCGREVIGDGD